MPRVVSSGSLEVYLDAYDDATEQLTRQASFCSLADLPPAYAFNRADLDTMLEPHAQFVRRFVPLHGCTWEFRPNPRIPDSCTSNSLCSASDDGHSCGM